MSEEYKPINNLWKDSEGYRYFGTLKLSSKIKHDGDDFIPLWEWVKQLQQENKQLKMINKEYERLNKEKNRGFKITNVQEYNIDKLLSYKKYKDNWNKLKEWVDKSYDYYINNADYIGGRLCFTDMKNNMQKLEQGSDSNVKD